MSSFSVVFGAILLILMPGAAHQSQMQPCPPLPSTPVPPPTPSSLFPIRRLPAGFHWVNLEVETAIMAQVRHALSGRGITAYREVGVKDSYALVIAITRKKDAQDFSTDTWSVFSVYLPAGKSDLLIRAGDIHFDRWVFVRIRNDNTPEPNELAIDYTECAESCDGGAMFTLLHLIPGIGWRARWGSANRTAIGYPTPGLAVNYGEPDGMETLGPVFAVLYAGDGGIEVGRWYRTRDRQLDHIENGNSIFKKDPKTGKDLVLDFDDVWRYSVAPETGEEKEEKLSGAAAISWERRLCSVWPDDAATPPTIGQGSKLCAPYRRNR